MNKFKSRLRWYSSLLLSALYGSTWFTHATLRDVQKSFYLSALMFGLCQLVWYLVMRYDEIPFFIPRQFGPFRRAVWSPANNRSLLAAVGYVLFFSTGYDLLTAAGPTTTVGWAGLSFQDDGLLVAILIRYIHYSYRLLETYQQTQLDNEHLLRENLDAQFAVLKQQIAPHFLFNSLNTLKSLVRRQQPTAEPYVQCLAEVYRYLLQQPHTDLSTLTAELHFLADYVYLQQVRFGESFRVHIAVPEALGATLIPPMTLQMLVENALKHNVVSVSRPLRVDVGVEADRLVVRNNRQPKLTPEPSPGLGLANISGRYQHLINCPIEVMCTEVDFQVSLPLIPAAHERPATGR